MSDSEELERALAPLRAGLTRMVDSGRVMADFPAEQRVALHISAIRAAEFPLEMVVGLLALAVDRLAVP